MVGLPSSFCLLLLLTSVCVSTGPENDGDVYQMPLPMPARGVNPPKVRSRPIVRTITPRRTPPFFVMYDAIHNKEMIINMTLLLRSRFRVEIWISNYRWFFFLQYNDYRCRATKLPITDNYIGQ